MATIEAKTIDLGSAGASTRLSTLKGRYRKITYRALATNAKVIYIGTTGIDATASPPTGFPIEPGEDFTVDLAGLFQDTGLPESSALNAVYGSAVNANDDVAFIAIMIG